MKDSCHNCGIIFDALVGNFELWGFGKSAICNKCKENEYQRGFRKGVKTVYSIIYQERDRTDFEDPTRIILDRIDDILEN